MLKLLLIAVSSLFVLTQGQAGADRNIESIPRRHSSPFPCLHPINPHMRDRDDRLRTFADRATKWPGHRIDATPREIADAGFFYFGKRDEVRCWYCNGSLQNWKRGSNPWDEHAKRFPKCEYVLHEKGVQFVQQIVSPTPNFGTPSSQNPVNVLFPNLPAIENNNEPRSSQYLRHTMRNQFVTENTPLNRRAAGFHPTEMSISSTTASESLTPHTPTHNPHQPVGIEAASFDSGSESAMFSESRQQRQEPYNSPEHVYGPQQPLEFDLSRRWESRWFWDPPQEQQGAPHELPGSPTRPENVNGYQRQERCELSPPSTDSATSSAQLPRLPSVADVILCKICMEREWSSVLYPCTHAVFCWICSMTLTECAECHVRIERVRHISCCRSFMDF